jgi:hypothetical protein
VDIFNGATKKWTTAALSSARFFLSATSLPEQGLAFFAGGGDNSPSKFFTVPWEWFCVVVFAVSRLMLFWEALFNTVDIFNGATGLWSTAALTKPRYWLTAASLPDQGLAFFAGGASIDSDGQCTCSAIVFCSQLSRCICIVPRL